MIPLFAILSLQQPVQATGPAPYWQQYVKYEITARLDEPTHVLAGDERVTYVNHSPDTLHIVSFHLYLNAFRAHSLWSQADSAEQVHRFDHLPDSAYGFNHIRQVAVGGVPVTPTYPFAPDSTIARLMLPAPLPPGDSVVITMNWDARTSIPPRRQGRRGRSYDFAQWYPKVVVYDKYGLEEHPLYPAGEFYGEFGDFYVKLDVPADQVIGATGVPVCGDPGWQTANRGSAPVVTGARDSDIGFVTTVERSMRTDPDTVLSTKITSHDCYDREAARLVARQVAGSDRKQLIWVAHDVHNFAITMSPDYRYEGGEWNGIQVHVLYQPGDEKTWGGGIVVNNTITTLKWMDFIFGKYPWPEMTVAHRIEGGGTEFPMMQMDGSPSLGLNLHEGGHSYLMGILANNEWREGWMDEGFTSFQTSWYEAIQAHTDAAIRTAETSVLFDDLDGISQPVSTRSEDFRDFNTYNAMIYTKGELFLHELRHVVGDSTMLQILRTYYARWKLRHVDEAAFKAVAEEESHRDLSTFFAQWLHAVVLTDYAATHAHRAEVADGWHTTLDVERKSPGVYPITIAVYAARDTGYATVDGIAETERVTVHTRSKPARVVLDPDEDSHDWDLLNNQQVLNPWIRLLRGGAPTHFYFDTYFSPQARRDALMVGVMPTIWYNDAGGITVGYRTQSNYLGRYDDNIGMSSCGTGIGARASLKVKECDASLSLRDPTWWRIPNVSEELHAFGVEGRASVGVSVEQHVTPHLGYGPRYTRGVSANWLATYDLNYLPPALWDDGGTFEGALWWGVADKVDQWQVQVTARAAGGVMYSNPGSGISTRQSYDAQAYGRPELTATATRTLGARWSLGVRGYAAAVISDDPVLLQRRLYAADADPYQTDGNPFLRSIGAPLIRDDCWCRWQTPGGGDLRGYSEMLSTDRLGAVNIELAARAWQSKHQLASRVNVALFADAGYVGNHASVGNGNSLALSIPVDHVLADAGLGVRVSQRIGRTAWVTRLDFPWYVTDPAYAIGHRQSTFGVNRLVVSLSPVIP
jgi:hypothetical protein